MAFNIQDQLQMHLIMNWHYDVGVKSNTLTYLEN